MTAGFYMVYNIFVSCWGNGETDMGNYENVGLLETLMPLIFILPAFVIALYSIFFYQKNGYAADKIVEDQNKWLYRKVGARRLGKKWVVLNFVILGILLIFGCINFFADSFAVRHFMLIAAMPVIFVLTTVYIVALMIFCRKKDDEEEDESGHFG